MYRCKLCFLIGVFKKTSTVCESTVGKKKIGRLKRLNYTKNVIEINPLCAFKKRKYPYTDTSVFRKKHSNNKREFYR